MCSPKILTMLFLNVSIELKYKSKGHLQCEASSSRFGCSQLEHGFEEEQWALTTTFFQNQVLGNIGPHINATKVTIGKCSMQIWNSSKICSSAERLITKNDKTRIIGTNLTRVIGRGEITPANK